MADMKDRMKTGIENLADLGKKAAEAGGETINRVSEAASQAAEGVTDKVREYGDDVTRLVRQHPLPALLVGFSLGYLMSRMCRS